jgi:hypothetical protein
MKGLLQSTSSNERGRSPQSQSVNYLTRNIHPRLLGHLLFDQRSGKEWSKVFWGNRLASSRMQRRVEGDREPREHIKPGIRKALFV